MEHVKRLCQLGSGSRKTGGGASSGTSASKETLRFTWARPQVLAYCIAQVLLYACLGDAFPETWEASKIVILGHVALLIFRESVARMNDQEDAIIMFSRCWVATYALTDGALWLVNQRSQLITGLSTGGMVGIHVLAMLQGVYMQVLGVRAWARLASVACSVTLFASLPAPWSKLGQPYETLGLAAAHLMGELFIWAAIRNGRSKPAHHRRA